MILRKEGNGMSCMRGNAMLASTTLLLLLCLLAGCSSADSSANGGGNAPPTKSIALTPTVVIAKSVQGTPGNGPIVVTSPTPVPGGNANSQQVVLKDRTLVLNSVSKQDSADGQSSLITLVLTVKNTSDMPIMNQASFFLLMSAEGDTFTYQYSSSDNFYSDVSAHDSRDGTVIFQIPKVAASQLRLLYRPEVQTETVLISLRV